jgi:hypothetical protein
MEDKYFLIEWSINDADAAEILCNILKDVGAKFCLEYTIEPKVMNVKRVTKEEFLTHIQ